MAQVTITSTRTNSNPCMDANMDHWKVTMKYFGRQMTLVFSKGYGHHGAEPNVQEVMSCLFSNASLIKNARNFYEWCNDLGFHCEDRKARRIYAACLSQAKKLQQFAGDDYDMLDER